MASQITSLDYADSTAAGRKIVQLHQARAALPLLHHFRSLGSLAGAVWPGAGRGADVSSGRILTPSAPVPEGDATVAAAGGAACISPFNCNSCLDCEHMGVRLVPLQMIRTINIKEEVLSVISDVADVSYAWQNIDSYTGAVPRPLLAMPRASNPRPARPQDSCRPASKPTRP